MRMLLLYSVFNLNLSILDRCIMQRFEARTACGSVILTSSAALQRQCSDCFLIENENENKLTLKKIRNKNETLVLKRHKTTIRYNKNC